MLPHRLILFTLSLWIVVDSIIAMILLYPPAYIWLFVRFIRVAIGFIVLLEAQRVRVNLLSRIRSADKPYRYTRIYTSLLGFIGVWLIVDGLTTGLLGYTHPILVWQFIRIVRLVVGLCLALTGLLYERLWLAG